jgi:hypothetical protein
LSDLEIAAHLQLSVHTVRNHIRHTLKKTGSSNRTQAVAWAFEAGLLKSPAESATEPPETGDAPPLVSSLPRLSDPGKLELEGLAIALVASLQRALADPDAWDGTLADFGRAFDSHIPMITWAHIPSRGKLTVTRAPAMGSDWQRRFDEHYAALNPFYDTLLRLPVDFFAATEDYPFGADFYTSPFYLEYCRSLDIEQGVVWTVFTDERWMAELFLTRSARAGSVGPDKRRLGDMVFPYVRYAMKALWDQAVGVESLTRNAALSLIGARAGMEKQLEAADRGLMLLDAAGHIVAANQRGEALLTSGSWIRPSPGGFLAANPLDTEQFRSAIATAARTAEGAIYTQPRRIRLRPARGETRELMVTVIPMMAAGNDAPVPTSRVRVMVMLEAAGLGP